MNKYLNFIIIICLSFYSAMVPFGILFQIFSIKSKDSPFYVSLVAFIVLLGFFFYFIAVIISLFKNRLLLPKVYLVIYLLFCLILFVYFEGFNIKKIYIIKSSGDLFFLSLPVLIILYALYNTYAIIRILKQKKCRVQTCRTTD